MGDVDEDVETGPRFARGLDGLLQEVDAALGVRHAAGLFAPHDRGKIEVGEHDGVGVHEGVLHDDEESVRGSSACGSDRAG